MVRKSIPQCGSYPWTRRVLSREENAPLHHQTFRGGMLGTCGSVGIAQRGMAKRRDVESCSKAHPGGGLEIS